MGKGLQKLGIKETIMLTGDIKAIGEKIGSNLSIDNVYTKLLPTDKIHMMEK